LLTDKRRIHLRFASVRTYTFFTTGFPRFLSIRGARGLQAFDLPLHMSILQLLPNPARQVLCLDPFEFGLTQRTVQVVDRLVVGVEHVPRFWRKKVHMMNISCVHRDIPQDPTLATEERSHSPLPHLVVLTIKVWRTRTPFLLRHLWILDWLESRRSVTGSDTN
jgi:hypothetical protein